MPATVAERDYLAALLTIGRGSLVAIDKTLLDARGRRRRRLLEERAAIAADVERLRWVLGDG